MKHCKTVQVGSEYILATVESEYFAASETENGKAQTSVSIYADRGGISENFFTIEEAKLVMAAWQELLEKAERQSK